MAAAPRSSGRDWLAAPAPTLCLDFANTRFWRGTSAPTETLGAWADLVAWCEKQAALPPTHAADLAEWGRLHGAAAAQEFAAAIALREGIYRVFAARAGAGALASDDLRRLNAALGRLPTRADLRPVAGGFAWHVAASRAPMALLTPVLWSAGDLLTSARFDRVRRCANPQCLWLFLDDSKSGNRRWCSMSACGNRAKAHRHYLRRKAGDSG